MFSRIQKLVGFVDCLRFFGALRFDLVFVVLCVSRSGVFGVDLLCMEVGGVSVVAFRSSESFYLFFSVCYSFLRQSSGQANI